MMDQDAFKAFETELMAIANAWKAKFSPDLRIKVADKILTKLKNQFSPSDPDTLNRITYISNKFEEKMFRNARSLDDYINGICKKMKPLDKPLHDSVVESSSKSIRPGLQPSFFPTTQREMSVFGSRSSHHMIHLQNEHHQLQHQLSNNKAEGSYHQSFICPLRHPSLAINIKFGTHLDHNQNQHPQLLNSKEVSINPSFIPPIRSQPTDQQAVLTQPRRGLLGPQLNGKVNERNKKHWQQSNVPDWQRLSLCQNKRSTLYHQPPGLSNVSGMQQQRKVTGTKANISTLQRHPHSTHVLQQCATTSPFGILQTIQPTELHQIVGFRKESSFPEKNVQLQTSATFVQPQNLIEQKKLLHCRGVLRKSRVSRKSTPSDKLANEADWYYDVYQKLQSVKEMCLPQLKFVYKRVSALFQQARQPEQAKKYEGMKIVLSTMINILEMPHSDMVHCHKEKLETCQNAIIGCIQKKKNVLECVEQNPKQMTLTHISGQNIQLQCIQQKQHQMHDYPS
ncbi:Mediator of RNA polymerase II transcription subunit 15a [Quillaja saponaria]|uniref:Mediator of RNA polymerase II transcription subunit 15a n=1 Tax=Quillaja saponaria TaxID=32244 RepID=A0AAD7Q7Y4_QUISA|nr:Mediator of RNA polymerase II transcription subunit 15a [Quillaja saponaria]